MRLPKAGDIEIVPSVFACGFGRLAAEIAEVEAVGARMIQFDIMDGHSVPNLSFGPPTRSSSAAPSSRRATELRQSKKSAGPSNPERNVAFQSFMTTFEMPRAAIRVLAGSV